MKYLTPSQSALLASEIYSIRESDPQGIFGFNNPLKKKFYFDTTSENLLKGKAGLRFLPFLRSTTGFGAIGFGIEDRSREAIIVTRGTNHAHDFVTDVQCGARVSSTGSIVHSGFNNTFQSMLPQIQRQFIGKPPLRVHCVGHSLGGAIATLTADWLASCTHHKAILYTFGCPRVGLEAFATKLSLSPKIEKIFRVTHKGDPVTMVPLWPFTHAPISREEFRADSGSSIQPSAHFMSAEDGGNPGYIQSVNGHSWETLSRRSDSILTFQSNQFLKYSDRHQTTFSRNGLEKITAGLVSILKTTGHYATLSAQAYGASYITFYDILAQTLEKIAAASTLQTEHVRGLLGHMLSFIGEGATLIKEVTYQLIRVVFNKMIRALHGLAGRSMAMV